MRLLTLLSLIFLFSSCMAQSTQPFASYQWSHRLLVVFTPDLEQSEYLTQQSDWEKVAEGFADRQLKIWIVTPETIDGEPIQATSDALYRRYGVMKDTFEVVLIGKDGGVKLKQNEALTSEKLFAVIDAMPMRRQEMRRRNE